MSRQEDLFSPTLYRLTTSTITTPQPLSRPLPLKILTPFVFPQESSGALQKTVIEDSIRCFEFQKEIKKTIRGNLSVFHASYVTVALGGICIVGQLRWDLSTNSRGKWLIPIPFLSFLQIQVDVMVSVSVYNVYGRVLWQM